MRLNCNAAKIEPFISPEKTPSFVIYVKVWLSVPGYENLAFKVG
jgi:hypothetical protein